MSIVRDSTKKLHTKLNWTHWERDSYLFASGRQWYPCWCSTWVTRNWCRTTWFLVSIFVWFETFSGVDHMASKFSIFPILWNVVDTLIKWSFSNWWRTFHWKFLSDRKISLADEDLLRLWETSLTFFRSPSHLLLHTLIYRLPVETLYEICMKFRHTDHRTRSIRPRTFWSSIANDDDVSTYD